MSRVKIKHSSLMEKRNPGHFYDQENGDSYLQNPTSM